MKLPNPERVIVEMDKIAGYCLNPEHPDGKHKARVFKSALDLDIDNAEELRTAILEAVITYDAIPAASNALWSKIYYRFSVDSVRQTGNHT